MTSSVSFAPGALATLRSLCEPHAGRAAAPYARETKAKPLRNLASAATGSVLRPARRVQIPSSGNSRTWSPSSCEPVVRRSPPHCVAYECRLPQISSILKARQVNDTCNENRQQCCQGGALTDTHAERAMPEEIAVSHELAQAGSVALLSRSEPAAGGHGPRAGRGGAQGCGAVRPAARVDARRPHWARRLREVSSRHWQVPQPSARSTPCPSPLSAARRPGENLSSDPDHKPQHYTLFFRCRLVAPGAELKQTTVSEI